jgi:hypothetical protein
MSFHWIRQTRLLRHVVWKTVEETMDNCRVCWVLGRLTTLWNLVPLFRSSHISHIRSCVERRWCWMDKAALNWAQRKLHARVGSSHDRPEYCACISGQLGDRRGLIDGIQNSCVWFQLFSVLLSAQMRDLQAHRPGDVIRNSHSTHFSLMCLD